MTTLAQRFTELRQAHNLTKAGFARSLGVAESTVGRWESGSQPSEAQLVKLRETYGVELALVSAAEADLLTAGAALRGDR